MIEAIASTQCYLVVDSLEGLPILVFLGRDPAIQGGPMGEPAHIELLPHAHRFGRPGRPSTGRPVLGQARGSRNRFREFASSEDLWEAGFLPVPRYRVCDEWNDYHIPWTATPSPDAARGDFDSSHGSR
jgi:hypothetical protein